MQLAPYAFQDADSRGRRFFEPSHPYRSDFQRDRDRVIHSKAFRRLEKKTQVFAPDVSDHFRNRLTHTLEVTQISRTIARALRLNADLCEVLALSHDIGHPPFSHEGEKVLDARMEQVGSGFEHNLHALRIVEDFELKYPAFRGLNLTFEVREGIVKHSRDYSAGEVVYLPLDEYRLGQLPPLEAQVIDLADEIAYNTADLDDGYGSGLLTASAVCDRVALFSDTYTTVGQEFAAAPDKLLFGETVRRVIDRLVTDLVTATAQKIAAERLDSVDAVRGHRRRVVEMSPEVAAANAELKEFLRTELYSHAVLKTARRRARLEELFDDYLAHPDALPADHLGRADQLGLHRVVCDYIAGMTDNFARAARAGASHRIGGLSA